MKFWQFCKKIAKYAFASYTGWELHSEVKGIANNQIAKDEAKDLMESKTQEIEIQTSDLKFIIFMMLAVMSLGVLAAVAIAVYKAISKNATKKFQRKLEA